MADERMKKLVESLLRRTDSGVQVWSPVSLARGHFRTELPGNHSATVYLDEDSDPVVSIRDQSGNILESVNGGYQQNRDIRQDLTRLYNVARRKALRVDEKLDDILKGLEQ